MLKINDGTWKAIAVIAGALITVGALCATIRSNEKRINKVEDKAASNEKAVVELKTDIKYIKETVTEIKQEVKK